MSDNENSGIGASGFVGGIAGGAAAGYFANRYVAKKGFLDVVKETDAGEGFKKAAEEIGSKNEKLVAAGKLHVHSMNNIMDRKGDFAKVSFVKDSANKGAYALYASAGGKNGRALLRGVKTLPEGIDAGTTITDPDKIKALFTGEKAYIKTAIEESEKHLANSLRKADGFASGFKRAGMGGKAGIVAAAVAGAGVGGFALKKIFGGSQHTARVEAERAQPPAAAGLSA